MFERFTNDARQVTHGAVAAAKDLGHGYVGTEHILLALLGHEQGIAHAVLSAEHLTTEGVRAAIDRHSGWDAEALDSIGIDLDAIRSKVEEAFGPGALDEPQQNRRRGWFRRQKPEQPSTGRPPFTARAKKVYELSLREALALKHNYIGTEHLLLGLIREGQGLAARIMTDSGIDLMTLRGKTIAATTGKEGGTPV